MPINSKQKGARGERAWRDKLREHGYDAHRSCQYSGKSPDGTSADVHSELPFHFEVKHCERWPIQDWISQAKSDAQRSGLPWIIAAKRNHAPFTVMMDADTFFAMLADRGH
jgi:Holliday junction resolvase